MGEGKGTGRVKERRRLAGVAKVVGTGGRAQKYLYIPLGFSPSFWFYPPFVQFIFLF